MDKWVTVVTGPGAMTPRTRSGRRGIVERIRRTRMTQGGSRYDRRRSALEKARLVSPLLQVEA